MPEECQCINPQEYRWIKWVSLAAYGAIAALGIVLFLEVAFVAVGFSTLLLAVVLAPIIEESFKALPLYVEKQPSNLLVSGVVIGTSFGLAEWLFHSIMTGTFVVSFQPFMHIVFMLPLMLIYNRERTKGTGWFVILVLVNIALHAIYNAVVMGV